MVDKMAQVAIHNLQQSFTAHLKTIDKLVNHVGELTNMAKEAKDKIESLEDEIRDIRRNVPDNR